MDPSISRNGADDTPRHAADAYRDDGIVGHAPALRDALERVERVASLDTTVLLTGETGTGKEVIARALHRRSRRAGRPLVTVNLASIPEGLVACELFGHEAGAFTGATQRRIGRFETADGSTLFLDEIGDLSLEMQVALLRVVQEGEYSRLGACQTRSVDTRLIVATNRSLEQSVDEGRFRADLFYRLSVFPIHLPPLRERPEDIPLLAEAFVRRLSVKLNRPFGGIEPSSMTRLVAFRWPGNIRQLQNILEQSFILSDGPELHVPAMLLAERAGSAQSASSTLDSALRWNEQRMIEQALEAADGQVSGGAGAAARLGVPASTLESKIRRFNIDKLRYRSCAVGRDKTGSWAGAASGAQHGQ